MAPPCSIETGLFRTASRRGKVSGRADAVAVTEPGKERAGFADAEKIGATGGGGGFCEAVGNATGSLTLDWVTSGAGFAKNIGDRKYPRLMANMPRNERGISFLFIQMGETRIENKIEEATGKFLDRIYRILWGFGV